MKPWHFILTHDWRTKLAALILATLLWLFIRHSIHYSPVLPTGLPPLPSPASTMRR